MTALPLDAIVPNHEAFVDPRNSGSIGYSGSLQPV